MRVLLVSFNFFRDDEYNDPYGVSCLITAFRNKVGQDQLRKDDEIFSHVINLQDYVDKGYVPKDAIWAMKNEIIRQIKDLYCDVVAFSNFVWADMIIQEIGPIIRHQFPKITFLMGGAMVKPSSGELNNKYSPCLGTKYPFVDGFIYSYGEKVLGNLPDYIDKLQKCRYNIIYDMPDFSSLMSPYIQGEIPLRPNMSVRMETRRGCIFSCSYCCHKSCEKTINQIGEKQKWYGELALFMKNNVAKINVLDPFFNDNNNEGIRFMEIVKKMKCKIPISVQIRPEFINEDYLNMASELGNFIFEIGIQSLDKNVLPHIGRGNELAVLFIKKKLSLLKSYNIDKERIKSEVTLIYGLPSQTADSFQRDIETLQSLGIDKVTAFPLQLYPGTDIYAEYNNYGLIAEKSEPFGILQICDNPTHDFEKMQAIAESINKETEMLKQSEKQSKEQSKIKRRLYA